jgi:hypothetical protein
LRGGLLEEQKEDTNDHDHGNRQEVSLPNALLAKLERPSKHPSEDQLTDSKKDFSAIEMDARSSSGHTFRHLSHLKSPIN